MAHLPLPGAFTRANPLPLPRRAIEQRIEALIALLDMADGDPDFEDADEDCCSAFEDRVYSLGSIAPWLEGAGDADDAEEDDPSGQCSEDEVSCGPDNWCANPALRRDWRSGTGPGCLISDDDRAEPVHSAAKSTLLLAIRQEIH